MLDDGRITDSQGRTVDFKNTIIILTSNLGSQFLLDGIDADGEVSEEARKLIEVTRQAFFEGIRFAKVGYRVHDIGEAVQDYVESHGFSVVRDFVGHGIGRSMHEAPEVPNYRPEGHRPNPRLVKGMTICVEPMVCAGDWRIRILNDGWTVVTADHSLAAHYENTILITDGEPEILTMSDDI